MPEEIDIIEIISLTINTLFSNLFSSIDNEIYSILDDITFINIDIFSNSFLSKIIGTTSSDGLLLICNSLLVGFILYYSINLLFSYIHFSSIQQPIPFLIRITIIAIIMNFSYFICKEFIYFNFLISSSIREIGENIFNESICFSSLIEDMNSVISISNDEFNLFSMKGLLKSFLTIGLLNLTLNYSLRYIFIEIFILISPFAILCLVFEKTKSIFLCWLKNFLSLLFLQSLISFILLITFSIQISLDDLLSQILYIACIHALTKSNQFMRDLFGSISTNITSSLSHLNTLLSRR